MMSPIIPVEHLSPVLRYTPISHPPLPPRPLVYRARKRARTPPRRLSPAPASRPNCTTSAQYYPPLNYSPPTAKIAPRPPQAPPRPRKSGSPHRYIFSADDSLDVSRPRVVVDEVCRDATWPIIFAPLFLSRLDTVIENPGLSGRAMLRTKPEKDPPPFALGHD